MSKSTSTSTLIRFYITKSKASHYHGSAWEQRDGKNFQRLVRTTVKHPSKEHALFELTQILIEKGYRTE